MAKPPSVSSPSLVYQSRSHTGYSSSAKMAYFMLHNVDHSNPRSSRHSQLYVCTLTPKPGQYEPKWLTVNFRAFSESVGEAFRPYILSRPRKSSPLFEPKTMPKTEPLCLQFCMLTSLLPTVPFLLFCSQPSQEKVDSLLRAEEAAKAAA